VLDHDAAHGVSYIFKLVGHFFEMVINLFADDEAHGVGALGWIIALIPASFW
jgi:hypothetical protein